MPAACRAFFCALCLSVACWLLVASCMLPGGHVAHCVLAGLGPVGGGAQQIPVHALCARREVEQCGRGRRAGVGESWCVHALAVLRPQAAGGTCWSVRCLSVVCSSQCCAVALHAACCMLHRARHVAGENLAMGQPTIDEVVKAWCRHLAHLTCNVEHATRNIKPCSTHARRNMKRNKLKRTRLPEARCAG